LPYGNVLFVCNGGNNANNYVYGHPPSYWYGFDGIALIAQNHPSAYAQDNIYYFEFSQITSLRQILVTAFVSEAPLLQ
jgi:hypothetical protein